MRFAFIALPAILLAGAAVAQSAGRSDARDSRANTPPVEYRSAFGGYRPFKDSELRDWRKANEQVGASGGHAGQRPAQAPGKEAAKPQPGHHGGHK